MGDSKPKRKKKFEMDANTYRLAVAGDNVAKDEIRDKEPSLRLFRRLRGNEIISL